MKISKIVAGKNTNANLLTLFRYNSLISDRPLAFCLSGGIDSTGLVSLTKKYHKKDKTSNLINFLVLVIYASAFPNLFF